MNPDEEPKDPPEQTPPEEPDPIDPPPGDPAPQEPPPEIPEPVIEPPPVEPPPEPEQPPAPEPPPEPAPPPRIVTAPPQESAPAAEESLYEPPPRAPERAARQTSVDENRPNDSTFADFGEPDIPMPRRVTRDDRRRARDARINLDLDLGRIKRRKRYGLVITTLSVIFIAFVLMPVTWAGVYLFIDAPSTMLMMQRAAEGQTIRHYPVPLNRMSPHIVRSVIAAEDANFCTHDGFDVEAIQDALESNARGGRMRGGSTVSQQTAKNLFLWPERSWVRKGFETYFTALIEFMWPKRRIMEHYLNVAEWGDGNFGIEAAARARFGVSAADLTPLQAARLAAVLPSPNRWRADNPGPYVRRRAASIVQRARVVRNEHMASCVLLLDRPS
jgi:monofunctional biosynthetic peptidoglycan transglycosylase